MFSAARIAAWLLGCGREQRPERPARKSGAHARVAGAPTAAVDSTWAELAAWAAGKRDPVREFERMLSAAEVSIPAELHELLARCLARRPARRLVNPGKLMAALKKLLDCPWARLTHPCSGCGLEFPGQALICPACGRDLPPAASATGPASGSRGGEAESPSRGSRRTTATTTATAILKRAAAASSGAAAGLPGAPAAAAVVAAVPGMTLIPAGSFLSGERKIPAHPARVFHRNDTGDGRRVQTILE